MSWDWGPVERIETEKRRLRTLSYLAGTPTYETSAGLIRLHLRNIGVPTDRSQVLACLEWLRAAELLTLRGEPKDPVARITTEGLEVARGEVFKPGVMRPDP